MFSVCTAACALLVLIAVPGSVSAADQRDRVRSVDRIEVRSAHVDTKQLAKRMTHVSRRPMGDERWVGTQIDSAGNSYAYFRTGVGTPFGPAWRLR